MPENLKRIIGRKNELAILNSINSSNKAEFVAVWGRRRIGKTFLIQEYFKDKSDFFMQVTGVKNAAKNKQLETFRLGIEKTFLQGSSITPFKNWNDAFKQLIAAIKATAFQNSKKVVVFIDEIPWLATNKAGLLEALDYYWNTELQKIDNLKIIICGSAASWIIKKIVNNKGGLHNRLTNRIKLSPFTLQETKEYLAYLNINYTNAAVLELYLALGGIPYYLNLINNNESVEQAIGRLCFFNGPLASEFDNLFSSLFDSSKNHYKIMTLLSEKRKGMHRTEIVVKSKIDGGLLTDILNELNESGFIQSLPTYLGKKNEIIYRIIDPFVLFYFKWIKTIKNKQFSDIETRNNLWHIIKTSNEYDIWTGYSFETVCYLHANKIRQALKIDFIRTQEGVWSYIPLKSHAKKKLDTPLISSGAQIDLVFDRDDNCISLCEIKCHKNNFVLSKEYAQELERKKEIFQKITKTEKQILFVIISASKVKQNSYLQSTVQNVIELDDFFS